MSIITCDRCDRDFNPERPWDVRGLVINYWGSGDGRWVCPQCTTQQERHNIRVTLVRISHPPYTFGDLAGSWHQPAVTETMDTNGHLFPDAEDLGRGVIDAALAQIPAELERN